MQDMASLNDEQKTMAMLSHLLGIFTGFIGALVVFIIYNEKGKSPFVRDNAKNALNFQISMLLYYFSCIVLMLALIIVLVGFLFIPVMWALWVFALVVEIIGSVRAYNGEVYKYPLAIPFIR